MLELSIPVTFTVECVAEYRQLFEQPLVGFASRGRSSVSVENFTKKKELAVPSSGHKQNNTHHTILYNILIFFFKFLFTYIIVAVVCKRKEEQPPPPEQPSPKKPRLVFTDLQRRTLQAIFKVQIRNS